MKKLNVTLKIGDTVTAVLFGGEIVTGQVEDIQICARGEKYGRSVSQCDMDKHSNGVLDLSCGHWCYFYQVKRIEQL